VHLFVCVIVIIYLYVYANMYVSVFLSSCVCNWDFGARESEATSVCVCSLVCVSLSIYMYMLACIFLFRYFSVSLYTRMGFFYFRFSFFPSSFLLLPLLLKPQSVTNVFFWRLLLSFSIPPSYFSLQPPPTHTLIPVSGDQNGNGEGGEACVYCWCVSLCTNEPRAGIHRHTFIRVHVRTHTHTYTHIHTHAHTYTHTQHTHA